MPVHDWTRVAEYVFSDFQLAWVAELRRSLNGGLLPLAHFSMIESATDTLTGASQPERGLVIRRRGKDGIVAVIEVVSAGNKSSEDAFRRMTDKLLAALRRGIHLLVLDVHPPTSRDPDGIHGAVWGRLDGTPFDLPPDADRTFAAYSAGPVKEAFVEPVAVGQTLPPMPLFLTPDGVGYVEVPLEATYSAAFAGLPRFLREILDAPPG